MALDVEGVIGGCVGGEKSLRGSHALEPLHLPLPSSGWLMRILRSIVAPSATLVAFCDSQMIGCGAAAGRHADGEHSYPGLDASEGRSRLGRLTRRACRAQFRRGGPIADVRSRRFPECLLVFPTDIDRRPDEMLHGPLFRVRTASTPIEPIHSLFCCSKFPVRAKAIPCSVAQRIFR